jgi:hypothetical protein
MSKIIVAVEDAPARPIPKTESEPLHAWMAKHRDHGRAGPWFDATIGEYHTWRCSCGERWQCKEVERIARPHWCTER